MLELNTNIPGLQGIRPRIVTILTDASYSTITTAGWLTVTSIAPQVLYNTDVALVVYNWNEQLRTGSKGLFSVSIASNGNITLATAENADAVTEPTPIPDGNLAEAAAGNTIVDSGIDSADVVTAPSDLVSGNIMEGGAGKTAIDGGYNIRSNVTTTWGGGGTTHQFTTPELAATAIVSATIKASANSVSITKALAGAGTLDITFSADPGAGTIVQYIATSVAKTS